MNIVITGATSFIGSNVLNELIKNQENKIWVVIRPNSKNIDRLPVHKNIIIVKLDMFEIEGLVNFIDEPVDVFYHFAWDGVRAPLRDDAEIQNANYSATMKAMEVCYKLHGCKFIGCGSQAEYGSMDGRIDENYPCKPNTEYGKAKLNAYLSLNEYALKHDIEFIWARIFSVYGLGDYAGSLVMTCIDKMSKNETLEFTECKQEWDYIYIDEVAEIFLKFATVKCENGIYNIASGKHRRLKEYVQTIKKLMDSGSILEFGKIPYPASGVVSFVPNINKLKNELKWESQVSFEEGIKIILQGKANEEN